MMKFLQVFLKFWNKLFQKSKLSHPPVQVKEEYKPPESIITTSAIIREAPKKQVVQVGLDFGTSNTKIAYSLLGIRRPQKNPILFNNKLDVYPDFCLPSVAAVNDQNKLIFGIEAAQFLSNKSWDEGLRRLKVVVAGRHNNNFRDELTENQFHEYLEKHLNTNSISPEQITSMYLAYAIYIARKEITNSLKSNDLDLMFNICIPIDHVQNNKVRFVFEKILAWAEIIEKEWTIQGESFDPLEFSTKVESKAKYGAKTNSFAREDQDARVFAVPESVAEIASYLYSSNRQSGMHALIDLGAGTTDISIFNLNRETNNTFWYSAGNIPDGTNRIEKKIIDYINERENNNMCRLIDVLKILRKLSSNNNINFEIERNIRAILNEIYQKTTRIWGKAYEKYPREHAFHNVNIFISGGGSYIPYVKDIFSVPWWTHIRGNYPINILPEPDDYNSFSGNVPFQRMTVAYGLCILLPILGNFRLPPDISDFDLPIDLGGGPEGIDDGDGLIPGPNW